MHKLKTQKYNVVKTNVVLFVKSGVLLRCRNVCCVTSSENPEVFHVLSHPAPLI